MSVELQTLRTWLLLTQHRYTSEEWTFRDGGGIKPEMLRLHGWAKHHLWCFSFKWKILKQTSKTKSKFTSTRAEQIFYWRLKQTHTVTSCWCVSLSHTHSHMAFTRLSSTGCEHVKQKHKPPYWKSLTVMQPMQQFWLSGHLLREDVTSFQDFPWPQHTKIPRLFTDFQKLSTSKSW